MSGLTWRDRITVEQHELTVAAVLLGRVVDAQAISEADWQRLLLVRIYYQALIASFTTPWHCSSLAP